MKGEGISLLAGFFGNVFNLGISMESLKVEGEGNNKGRRLDILCLKKV